eukprot:2739234-Amphidinium_carterae.1
MRKHKHCVAEPPTLQDLRQQHKAPEGFTLVQRQLIGSSCCRAMIVSDRCAASTRLQERHQECVSLHATQDKPRRLEKRAIAAWAGS